MTIGKIIRLKREEAGLTQQQLAEKLFVSRQTISRWESGSRFPDLITSRKIATVLGVSMDELVVSNEQVCDNANELSSTSRKKIFAGLDCGGSNTRCVLVSESGEILGVGKGGESNYSFGGKLVASESIRQSINQAFKNAKLKVTKIDGMFIASAAVEVYSGAEHEEFFKQATGCQNLKCNSDIFPVWYAGNRFKPAVVMIAGTGSVAYLLKEDGFEKVGGWGYQVGDEGSGYNIGINVIRTATRMADGREPMDEQFFLSVMNHFGANPTMPLQLLNVLTHVDSRKKVASVAKPLMELYDKGNPIALSIIGKASDELVLLLKTIIKKADKSFALLLSGGLMQSDTPIRRELIKKLAGVGCISNIIALNGEVACASAAIALLNSGREDSAERLMNTIKGVEIL